MEPPNRYTNMTINMIGRTRAVIMPSTLRSDRRNARSDIVRASSRKWLDSDTFGLLAGGGVVAGEGQEDVIQAGRAEGEPVDASTGRIDLVEDGPDLAGPAGD